MLLQNGNPMSHFLHQHKRLLISDMIQRVNIINTKAYAASINRTWESGGHSEDLREGFREWNPLRKLLGSKEHLDLNVVEIITIQDYKHTKK